MSIPDALNRISGQVVDAAIEVHRVLGPGLLESVYARCLRHELQLRGLQTQSQISIPVRFKDLELGDALRLDLLVEHGVIVEVKSVETLLPVHHAQLLSYLKLSNLHVGLLINFNVPLLKDGFYRLVR